MRVSVAVLLLGLLAMGCASRKDGSPYDTPFTHTNSDSNGLTHILTVGKHEAEWIHPGESVTWELDRSQRHDVVWKIMRPIGGSYYEQLKVNHFQLEWNVQEADWYFLPD